MWEGGYVSMVGDTREKRGGRTSGDRRVCRKCLGFVPCVRRLL